MRLILMRHAKSDWSSAIPNDHERTLNARGIASASAMGNWLRENEYLPQQVLSSSSTRTRQTTELLGFDVPTEFQDRLYLASSDVMFSCLRNATAAVVLMIAHNPGIADFANMLVKTRPDHVRFFDYPTCATLVVDFDIENWSDLKAHTGVNCNFAIPREVMGLES